MMLSVAANENFSGCSFVIREKEAIQMHCPQCGLQQVSGKVRFCRACGFSLSGVKELVLTDERAAKAEKTRFEKAFNQGLALMLISLVAAIILTLLQDAHLIPQIYVKIVAALFILAGLARMFTLMSSVKV